MTTATPLGWLGYPDSERIQCLLFGWLVEAVGATALGRIVGADVGRELIRITSETPLGQRTDSGRQKSRIDLFAETDTHLVGLEAKVKASARGEQLRRYADALLSKAARLEKRALLAFVTESGEVPEYPSELRRRIHPVELRLRTWDQAVELVSEGPSNGVQRDWGKAARLRCEQIEERIAATVGTCALPEGEPRAGEWNLRARGVKALADAICAQLTEAGTPIEVIAGARRGANQQDLIVDIGRATWSVPLPPWGQLSKAVRDKLDDGSPFADGRPRFTCRIRFNMDSRGRLQLQVGSHFVPYFNTLIAKKERGPVLAAAREAMRAADELRSRICRAFTTGSNAAMAASLYKQHTILVERNAWLRDGTTRVARGAAACRAAAAAIDSALA